MGVFAGPEIPENRLVLTLDAANLKSYDSYENLLTYSDDFSNAAWVKQGGFSITSNTAIAPDGTLTADTASRVNLGSEYLYQTTSASGTYTLSCWVRSVTGTTTFVMNSFNVTDGTITSPTFTATTTWQRFSYTFTVTTTNGWYPCIPSVSGVQLYIWGAQLERGTTVGLYYPTVASTKSRGTTLTDLSGRGNTGTLTNGPTFSSTNGGSIVFDGTNDYAPIGSSGFPFGSSPGTLSTWARTNTISGGFSWIVSYGNATISQSRFLGINASTYYFGGYGDDITASGVPLNTWFNMVGVYNGTNASMYINGVLVSGPTAKTWNTVAGNAQIGRQTNGSEYWNGNIAQVSIHNRALTATEIQQNFNALRGRFGI